MRSGQSSGGFLDPGRGATLSTAIKRRLQLLVVSVYQGLYARLAGAHPNQRRLNFQWLAAASVHGDLRHTLASVTGRVLDVGCAEKPYASWAPGASQWFGIDVYDGPHVDAVVEPGKPWPVPDESFDIVLCAAMLSHVGDLDHFAAEVDRVLVPGGIVVATVPFIYNEVTTTEYWRFTRHGIRRVFERRATVLEVTTRGGIGTVLGVLLLNWIETSLAQHRVLWYFGIFTLPIRALLAAVVNTIGPVLDRLDRTGLFYATTFLLAQKPPSVSPGILEPVNLTPE